jgi:lipoprotein-anchoring transpeptidase ErfK/SrfK
VTRSQRRRAPLGLIVAAVVVAGAVGAWAWFDSGGAQEGASGSLVANNEPTIRDAGGPLLASDGGAGPVTTPATREPDPAQGQVLDDVVRRMESEPTSPDGPTGASAGESPVTPAQAEPRAQQPVVREASRGTMALVGEADRRINENRPLEARELLWQAMHDPSLGDMDRMQIMDRLSAINADLVFGPKILPGDPLVVEYRVKPGDSLARIASRNDLSIDWRFIQRVNRISDPSRIRVDQRLKLVRGPFHAVVTKHLYRLDLYVGPPDREGEWLYITSFDVGLGESGGTPTGEFVVRPDSKLVNPAWANPRTGERFSADDPKNPIGERWLGIDGIGDSAVHLGYGIHGTIEPQSIGREMSMGCVRLGNDDVQVVYEVLSEGISRVRIMP